jgi:uncharacterized membrane protein
MQSSDRFSARAADVTAAFCGSWGFIFVFAAITFGWGAWNVERGAVAFDPYPFVFFNLILTVVSTFQSPIIMMSQNRMTEREAEHVREILATVRELREEVLRYRSDATREETA